MNWTLLNVYSDVYTVALLRGRSLNALKGPKLEVQLLKSCFDKLAGVFRRG